MKTLPIEPTEEMLQSYSEVYNLKTPLGRQRAEQHYAYLLEAAPIIEEVLNPYYCAECKGRTDYPQTPPPQKD